MPITVADVTSQYGVLKSICTHLRIQDVVAIAATCSNLHGHIAGNAARREQLMAAATQCDGTSGQIWRAAIGESIHHALGDVKASLFPSATLEEIAKEKRNLESLQPALDLASCGSDSTPRHHSRPCRDCGEPVCNVGLFRDLLYHASALTLPAFY